MRAACVVLIVGLALAACQPAPPTAQPSPARSATCAASPHVRLAFGGSDYVGSGPFYVGALPVLTGDLNKVPWAVSPGYGSPMTVTGSRGTGAGAGNFGFRPTGFGTPAQQPGVPVSFEHPDQQGRTIVFQPQLT